VALLASYGQMRNDPAAVDLLAKTLAAFAVGLPFFSAFQLLTRTFYAIHDARTPALTNIAAGVVKPRRGRGAGVRVRARRAGLALGFSLSYLAGSVILFLLLRRASRRDGRRIASSLGRTAAAAALTALAAWATAESIAAVIDVDRPSSTWCRSPRRSRRACLRSSWAPLSSRSRKPMRSGEPWRLASADDRHPSRSLHDQAGLIGKVAIVWIIVLLVVGLLVWTRSRSCSRRSAVEHRAGAASTAADDVPLGAGRHEAWLAAEPDLLHDNVSCRTTTPGARSTRHRDRRRSPSERRRRA
jgi:hypothetical protein